MHLKSRSFNLYVENETKLYCQIFSYISAYAFAFDSLKLGKDMNGSSKFLNKKLVNMIIMSRVLKWEMSSVQNSWLRCATDCKMWNKALLISQICTCFWMFISLNRFLVKLLVHKNNNSTSNGFLAPLWNILMTRAKKQ